MLDPVRHQAEDAGADSLALLVLVSTPVRPLNDALWSLLLKPGPLTAAEWAIIEAQERAWEEAEQANQTAC